MPSFWSTQPKRATGGGATVGLRQWLDEAKRDAYGPLKLKPWELGQLLPGELNEMRDGYDWRRERDQKDLAILLATIMNASWRFRRWIQPGELLEKPKPEPRAESRSADDRAAELEWLKKKLHDGN